MAAQLTIRRRERIMPIMSSQLLVLTVATIITVLGFGLTTTMGASPPPPSPKRPQPPVKSPTPPPPVKLSPSPQPPPPVKLSPSPKPPPPVKLSPSPQPPPPVKLSPPPKLSSPPKSPPPSRYPRPPPPPPSLSSFNDTLRLVRGSELKGRLEVKVGSAGPSAVPREDEWVTLCDDGSFTTYEAMLICQKCGFLYGRPYYASGVNSFGADEVDRPRTMGNIICYGDGQSVPTDLHPIGSLSFFNEYEMQCYVYESTCPNQVLVGLECSNNPFPTASPPPPVPPRPPPPPFPPPSMQNDIKLIFVEDGRPFIYRVELRVNSSSDGHTGPSVWAPVCAPSSDDVYGNSMYEASFATTMCKQADGFRKDPSVFSVHGELVKYALPTGFSSSLGGFDPAQYTRWVTVVGNFDAYTVQGMTLQVSNKTCTSGFILGLQCFWYYL
ncbi:hypothetical protein Vretimale_7302 [Volvox reticuliferus]|uniref:SRCR domain-containing protein n=1 Tax=Volvox reticuliferus TaxID=1737510 RepID=A0A8J4G998_9CHLO|nr:hypothetical protein Vretimale_7302 [Volvox reticuliferus]GIM02436.1 hypothetical protein Vretimale_7302 [Volvox reticuliferus]